MRICIMAALIMIGARLEMPWYFWLVIMTDISVLIAKAVYSTRGEWDKRQIVEGGGIMDNIKKVR